MFYFWFRANKGQMGTRLIVSCNLSVAIGLTGASGIDTGISLLDRYSRSHLENAYRKRVVKAGLETGFRNKNRNLLPPGAYSDLPRQCTRYL
jgi:hypothetical protein